MRKVEVLIATMNQYDFSKYYEMNIQTDAVFANQGDKHRYQENIIDGNKVKMITSETKGVGINRNIALLYSNSKYIVFADDDVTYEDNYEDKIVKAFQEVPDADILLFNVEMNGSRKQKINDKIKRVRLWSFFPYGTVRIVARRKSILKKNIWFSLLFGGGTKYSSGEDSLFLRTALKENLYIYTYPENLAKIDTNSSTWFQGYNEKYFIDKGAWIKAAFPRMSLLVVLLFSIRFKFRTSYTVKQLINYMKQGIKDYKH